ncbi:MAG: hypothetical protein J6P21_03985 [Clostridia bacterium]|nr:hypothetical protein [Clostridia bacterium]
MSFIDYKYNNFQQQNMFLKLGIVKSLDNSKDTNRKDRILVSFLNEESECFASMLYNYFGEKFGTVWYPDPGTIVVVAFLENCIDRAVILGCLNKYEEDILPISTDNKQEVFKHKNGTLVKFENQEDAPKITINTKDDKEIINIDLANENFEIKNKDESTKLIINFKESKIEIKSKSISFEAEENFNIKSKILNIELSDKFTLKGAGIELNSSGNMNIESSAGTDIKSNGIININ